MEFKKVDDSEISENIPDEKIFLDTMAIAKLIKKNQYDFNEALRRRAKERNRTPNDIRANVTANLSLISDDWHGFKNGNERLKNKIKEALINKYRHKKNEILDVFK